MVIVTTANPSDEEDWDCSILMITPPLLLIFSMACVSTGAIEFVPPDMIYT